jgi:hypothetical protein
VFIIYAIPLGVLIGYLRGGRMEGLAGIGFQWAPAAILALLAQVVLFSPLMVGAGAWIPILYIATTGIVLAVVIANRHLPGLRIGAAGAVCNLAAILANGGYMPASREALEFAGLSATDDVANSIVVANPALGFLTDIFALPAFLPLANVFSFGDLLIGIGIARAIAWGMTREPKTA